jgi:hypothetical protein
MGKIEELRAMMDAGEFHHATYRDIGKLWEGLRVYRCADNGFNGFEPAMLFERDHPDREIAYSLVRHTGVSVGRRGEG